MELVILSLHPQILVFSYYLTYFLITFASPLFAPVFALSCFQYLLHLLHLSTQALCVECVDVRAELESILFISA